LLFVWKGADASLKPILLVAHQDVVPIETGTEGKWTHPPFSGAVADGFIWGRGTVDDKGSLGGILEAVNTLLAKGFQPKRTIYLAFGQDEEIGGSNGAEKVADLLKTRGKEFEFVLDEGYAIVSKNMVPGVSAPVAIIGTSEKGYLSLEPTVDSPGGHSSMPQRESSIGILSAAVQAVERHPMPAHLDGPVGQFFEYLEGNTSLPHASRFQEHVVVWTRGAEDLGGIAGFQCDVANDDRCDNLSSRNKRQRVTDPGARRRQFPIAPRRLDCRRIGARAQGSERSPSESAAHCEENTNGSVAGIKFQLAQFHNHPANAGAGLS